MSKKKSKKKNTTKRPKGEGTWIPVDYPSPRREQGPKEGEPGEFVIVTITDIVPPAVYTATVQADGYFDEGLYQEIAALRQEFEEGGGREKAEREAALIAEPRPSVTERRTVLNQQLQRTFGGERYHTSLLSQGFCRAVGKLAGIKARDVTGHMARWAYPNIRLVETPALWFPADDDAVLRYAGGTPNSVVIVHDDIEDLRCHTLNGRDYWLSFGEMFEGASDSTPEARFKRVRKEAKHLRELPLEWAPHFLVYGLTRRQVSELGDRFVYMPGRYKRGS